MTFTAGSRMPPRIAGMLRGLEARTNAVGKSGATVLEYPEFVLKVRPSSPAADREARILSWLQTKGLPSPRVAAREVLDGTDWLLMERIRGKMLCDPDVMNRPSLLLDCLAEGLHVLWRTDVSDCPFERTWSSELDQAERAIRAGTFDPSDCEPETFGPGGFRDPMALLDWLHENTPPEQRVLTHGDYCLPNLFTDGEGFTGMIDLGDCGVADPWRDLSLGWRSLKHNSDGHYGKTYPAVDPDDLFRAAGVPKDEERLRYYLLLDELF